MLQKLAAQLRQNSQRALTQLLADPSSDWARQVYQRAIVRELSLEIVARGR